MRFLSLPEYRKSEISRRFVGLLDRLAKSEVVVMGDSHVRVFRHPMMKAYFPFTKFRVVPVTGATASGLSNPHSSTQAYKIFNSELPSLRLDSTVILMLGEVDTGFVIWYRAQKYRSDLPAMLGVAVDNYSAFIKDTSRLAKVIVISAPLPTIKDGQTHGGVANLRSTVKASQRDRTNLTVLFNLMIEKLCLEAGISYLNLDGACLGERGMVAEYLINPDLADHHYKRIAYARVLGRSLRRYFANPEASRY